MSQLTLLDILLRSLCLGQLLFFFIWVVVRGAQPKQFTFERWLLSVLLVCCMGAVVLTMHYRPPLIYVLRPVLLALTDGLSFVFWMYVVFSLSDVQSSARRLDWLKIGVVVYLFWHFYFFIINEGRGSLHDVTHAFAGLAVFHVIYLSIASWRDDLVGSRRRRRAIFLVAACAIIVIYVASEVSGTRFMRSELGSLIGAGVLLSFTLSFGVFCFLGLASELSVPDKSEPDSASQASLEDIPFQHRALYQRLTEFMERQEFTEPQLTLTRLAHQLDSKEHRLRSLINQYLGYRNFSSYLNDQRLPLACDWLQNKPDLPITDIAMNLGYGSITSFNRAFKAKYRVSPRDYRVTILKKR